MTKPSASEQQDPTEPRVDKGTTMIANLHDLNQDPDFHQLLTHYQAAKFKKCKHLLNDLLRKYPGHEVLLKFREELEMKLSVKGLSSSIQKEERISRGMSTLKLSLVAVISTLVVLAALFLSLTYFTDSLTTPEPAEAAPTEHPMKAQLDLLYNQAEVLLRLGQPNQAVPIVEKILEINPDHPNLTELQAQLETLLHFETLYQAGLNHVAEGRFSEALEIFRNIEAGQPGLWDVSQQIAAAEKTVQIEGYLGEGEAAYQAGNWQMAINAYENALLLDHSLDDLLIKERLLTSYLNLIRQFLTDDTLTIEDFETAEDSYRKAANLISQDPTFAWARDDLNEVYTKLQEVKLTQGAKVTLGNSTQTPGAVAQAVSDLEKAAQIQPGNASLQQDLQNAQNYQIGLNHFLDLNWASAITDLKAVTDVEPNFANGNAAVLLYEAYVAAGLDLIGAAQYAEGLNFLEEAEALVLATSDNLAKHFQIQILIGDTHGLTEAHQNAVTYYQNALNAVDTAARVQDFPDLIVRLEAANNSASEGQYESALAAFRDLVESLQDVLYSQQEIAISNGAIVALFAHSNASTLTLVLQENNLPMEMVIRDGRALQVPLIEK